MAAPRGGSIALLVGAIACAGLGASLALRDFGGGAEAVTLGFAATMERERAIRIEGFTDADTLLLAEAWRARGLEVTDSPEAPRVALLRVSDALARDVMDGRWGKLPASDMFSITCEDPDLPGALATFVLLAEDAPPIAASPAIRSLMRALPPGRPQVRAWVLDLAGFGANEIPLDTSPSQAATRLREGTRLLREWIGDEDLGAAEPRVWITNSVAQRPDRGSVGELAWSRPGSDAAFGLALDGVEDDLLRAYARDLLLDALGPPADPWFADGLVEQLVEATRDEGPAVDAVASLDVTFEEALGVEPRTRAARLPAAALLASLCAIDPAQRTAAWRGGVAGEALTKLRGDWDRERAGAVTADGTTAGDAAPRRRLPRTVAVRLTGGFSGEHGYGTWASQRQLERIAELGFGAVVLTVHAPIAPPSQDDPRRALELGGWGRFATTDGDGAVLALSQYARHLGLEVVLWPRFVAGPGGTVAYQQIHPDAPSVHEFGRRYALAVEGVAHLAERAGAVGLVLFEPDLMPRPAAVPEDVRLAYAGLRRQAIAFARPFRGELLALGRGRPRLERALQMSELAPDSGITFGFDLGSLGGDVNRPWSAYEKRLRSVLGVTKDRMRTVEVAVDGSVPERRDDLLRAAAQALGAVAEVDLVILSHWALDRGDEDPSRFDVSAAPEDVLRALTRVRK